MQLWTAHRSVIVAAALMLAGGLAAWLYHARSDGQASGIVSGNGRLEATEIDIATRVGGRLTAVTLQEGDEVARGQILAELDAAELSARLRAAEAQLQQAHERIDETRAAVSSARTDVALADKVLQRTRELVARGFVSAERRDRDQTALDGERADLLAAQSRLAEAQAAMMAARAQVDSVKAAMDDTVLRSPLAGRVLYRYVQAGEVLAAGGKVLTLLDMSELTMSIYLPAADAGKIVLGDEACLVLDALPSTPIPARVSFVSPRAQFTPKEVETRGEREKLSFRVKVQVSPEWLQAQARLAKPGMPGLAHVRIDPAANWPPALTPGGAGSR